MAKVCVSAIGKKCKGVLGESMPFIAGNKKMLHALVKETMVSDLKLKETMVSDLKLKETTVTTLKTEWKQWLVT